MIPNRAKYPTIRYPAPRITREGEAGYRRCVACIMDTTDPFITFDADGRCNHCALVDKLKLQWNPEGDPEALEKLVERIRRDGRGLDYDVIMGLSGGVDSSYAVYLAKQLGLRVLVIHVDTGWNSEQATNNIRNIVDRCGFDLHTDVVDFEEMRDLQLAFFRAGVPNQDIPQDHAIFAGFYNFAAAFGVRWSISGYNHASESILPAAWAFDNMDLRHIQDIHRRFGQRTLRSLPRMSYFRHGVVHQLVRNWNIARPLNLISYTKEEALKTLQAEMGWQYYGGKHFESNFTKFFQGWYLPVKWGYDKRLPHLSSLIASGQMSRAAALEEIRQDVLSSADIATVREYMCDRLEISEGDFEQLMHVPNIPHENYAKTSRVLKRGLLAGAALKRRILAGNL